MKAEAYSLAQIFGPEVRYVVPLYQRPYVWKLETHWRPLWEDVRLTADQLLVDEADEQTSNRSHRAHFLGAVVLDQQLVQTGSVLARTVIDGQQRLTTLQLLLVAAAQVAVEVKEEKSARVLRKLVFNDRDFVEDSPDKYKVWPTNSDRAAFTAVVDEPLWGGESSFAQAVAFFRVAIREWIDDSGYAAPACLQALTRTLRELLKVVAIDLEPTDNAQVIFESLNGRGQPLLAIDLVKNLVFQLAAMARMNLDHVHTAYWSKFDRQYWRDQVRQGRLNRARAEIFLMHWLSYQTAEEVAADQLYPRFKSLAMKSGEQAIEPLLVEFSGDADLFESFDAVPDPAQRLFFHRLAILDTSTVYPLLIHLFKACEGGALSTALRMIESFLVRRMLCRLTTKNYNRLFLDWLKAIRASALPEQRALLEAMRKGEGDSARWPNDEEVRSSVEGLPAYGSLSQARIVMVLTAIDYAMRGNKAESIPLPTGLTIEHVMPQSWKQNWPLPDGSPLEKEIAREQHINRFGNLTLVTGALNPSLSNSPWLTKRPELNKHSVLMMNRRLHDENPESWDEESISARAELIASLVCSIWPGPVAAWEGVAVPDVTTVDLSTLAPSNPEVEVDDTSAVEDLSKLILVHFPGHSTSHLAAPNSATTVCHFQNPGLVPYPEIVPLTCSMCRSRAFRLNLRLNDEPIHRGYPGVAGVDPSNLEMRWLDQDSDPRYAHLRPTVAGVAEPDPDQPQGADG